MLQQVSFKLWLGSEELSVTPEIYFHLEEAVKLSIGFIHQSEISNARFYRKPLSSIWIMHGFSIHSTFPIPVEFALHGKAEFQNRFGNQAELSTKKICGTDWQSDMLSSIHKVSQRPKWCQWVLNKTQWGPIGKRRMSEISYRFHHWSQNSQQLLTFTSFGGLLQNKTVCPASGWNSRR